ncbi:ankyrin repeat-containing [Diplodia corticola]|uniref:Ankyrin repeat-containing n=1 Tax=Diplodia corticola TaxID=236234 RepID=A0A1J9RX81_9PEZI|nr:ankyrin repeat-containing [Diplodia corticola]OJD32444.1 ankyrin repeat-containing [Diplodia corticola]
MGLQPLSKRRTAACDHLLCRPLICVKCVVTLQLIHHKVLLIPIIRVCTSLSLSNPKTTMKRSGVYEEDSSAPKRDRQDADAGTPLPSRPKEHSPDSDEIKRKETLSWLTSASHAIKHANCSAQYLQGSSRWFLTSPHFTSWFGGRENALFCPGPPGCGKTVLASIVIDYLRATRKSKSTKIAFIFCEENSRQDQSASSLLAELLKQLVEEDASLPIGVRTLYGSRPEASELSKILRSVASRCGRVFVVVDAIDQCSNQVREELLDAIDHLRGESNTAFLVTSRKEPSIEKLFADYSRLDMQASDEDIGDYVDKEISTRLDWLEQSEFSQRIREVLVETANGIFLSARLCVELLSDRLTQEEAETELTFIKSLTRNGGVFRQLYARLVGTIDCAGARHRTWAHRLLAWVFHSKDPLTVAELQHALAIREGVEGLCKDRLVSVDKISTFCAGLVSVDCKSGLVYPVHKSAREYFAESPPSWMAGARLDLARACLAYLQLDRLAGGPAATLEQFERRLSEMPFLSYAANNWAGLALGFHEALLRPATAFLLDNALTASACQVMFSPQNFGGKYIMENYTIKHAPHGCHILAFFGLADLLGLVLGGIHGSWDIIDEKDPEGLTPLALASIHGRPEVVELLLKLEEVDPNSKDPYNETPLHHAVCNGNTSVVKTLLASERVDANYRGCEHGIPPFHFAIGGEDKALVRMMMDEFKHRIDFNAPDRARYTAMHKAAHCEDSDMMEILFELGNGYVDFNAKDIDGWTALHHARFYKSVAVQQFLYTQKDVFDVDVVAYCGWHSGLDTKITTGRYEQRRGKSPHPLVYYLQNKP